ncbi:hypothetical protein SEUBUCD646_0B04090 [Saccharomyces eubayanus]|uniref:CFT1-like protein n=1 Tax=Saccharomyces eubayanus TaxID=1080349 RepID=A0ABN8VVI5_SACEU|nr:hypothetical protein SEUBUCD650_0B04100 [Saccharomyces eubayanus]CAI1876944.1 hypothetical protein SEUBUCD646_0B04090 [Saccharomyces eubayanus]
MNVYDDVVDATVVSHSITAHFTTSEYEELLVVRTNILSVYRPTRDGKLYLTYEFKFHGLITDIGVVPQQDSLLSCLLLCTGVAKISILQFNTLTNSIDTLSLHYYEDKFKDKSLVELAKTSTLRIDPGNSCALLFNNDILAFLPFQTNKNDEDDEEDEENLDEEELVHSTDEKSQTLSAFNSRKKIKSYETFTEASVILTANELYDGAKNIIDIQFLNNFTKPTISILYQPKLAWAGNSILSKLPTQYVTLTLNIQSAKKSSIIESTTIAFVKGLPWDLHTIVPVSNGAIIVGANELAFIDNTGALQSTILLNSFADKDLQKTKIIDNSSLEILFREKGTTSIWMPSSKSKNGANNNDETLLLMDIKSNIYYIQMEAEGRLLITFDIFKLPIVNDLLKENSNPRSITRLNATSSNKNMDLFIGFGSGNALVLRLNNLKSTIETREEHKTSFSDQNTLMDDNDEDDEEMDDLYADEAPENGLTNTGSKDTVETVQPFDIELLSSLKNIGPITSLTVGKVSSIDDIVKGLPNPNKNEYSLVATSGNGSGSHLTAIQTSVQPEIELALKFISITQIWNLKIKGRDKYLVTTDSTKSRSDIYESDRNFELHKGGRLRRDATTVYISMFGEDKRIIQVTTNHLYLYDTHFRRLTTIKFDYEVIHVSVMDPYILITVSRGDIKIFELETKNKRKLLKIDLPEILKEMVITSGLILKSNMCNEFLIGLSKSQEEQLLFTFVTADNQIIFFTKDHNDRIFQLNGVDQLNESLYISTYTLLDEIVPDPSIKQVMINKLGHDNKEEYLTILTFGGEIYQYRKLPQKRSRFYRNVTRNDLAITGAPDNAYAKGVSSIERIMHYFPDYNGYSVIFVTGSVPYILIKEDDSTPKIFKFANIPLVSVTPWNERSVMCVDDIKNARVYTLTVNNMYYGNKLPLKQIKISNVLDDYKTLQKIVYHEKAQLYLVSYCKRIPYEALGEDGEKVVGYDEEAPHAEGFQSGILLINPKSWKVIDQIDFSKNSVVNEMRSSMIQINSKTKRKREYIIAGVANATTEDTPPTGAFHIYDVTEVVPEPGNPDTNYKLKEIFQEEVSGIVSTVCEISGRFMISQSQKVLVRDIQEDNSVIPVAFLDIPVFVTDSKSFGNLLIIGDAMQGFQFIGFDAEPYRMISLGRSISKFQTMSLEFLVNGGDIYFSATDADRNVHVLKYAPDEPNSLSGQRLVHCSSFTLHSVNSCMMLLPKNEEFGSAQVPSFQNVGGQVDGSVFKLVPLSEETYRRLYLIQQQIIDRELQLGGLNPRMERLANDFYQMGHAMRPMLDFNVIRRFSGLAIDRRRNTAQKAGRQAHFEAWRDIINIEFSLRSLCRNK